MSIDINAELESGDYKIEYSKSLYILNSMIQCLMFIKLNCSRSVALRENLFSLFVIEDIFQSTVAVKILLTEGVRNSCRRELRYLIELAIKACLVSQKYSDKSIEEQLILYENELKSTNVSMLNDIDFYFFDCQDKSDFISDTKRMYGFLCSYVHSTPKQIKERMTLDCAGRTIGLEGVNELYELNTEMGKALSFVIIMFFHSIPSWCVGDYIVEKDGTTVDSYFNKSKYFALIDKYFDYKHERKDKLSEIIKNRTINIEF